jgi:hypothetical protein
MTAAHEAVLRLSPKLAVLPIIHASGDMAQEVRETLIAKRFDCLAVPLPPTVEAPVEEAIEALPLIRLVCIPEPPRGEAPSVSFVPVDPCQAVIMALRVAMSEGMPRAYIDREVTTFEPMPFAAPDAYALKRVSSAAYAAAMLPFLPAPNPTSQQAQRIAWMAFRLHELELEYDSILCLCHLADWPWLREAYRKRRPYEPPEVLTGRPASFVIEPQTLYFALAELPFITELYERRRTQLRSDRHLSIDGIKELLLESRATWLAERREEHTDAVNWVTPHLLQLYLQYVRNLALLERRLTPDLYSLVTAAKQMAGDAFAVTLLQIARRYAYQDTASFAGPTVSAGIGKLEFPDGEVALAANRLGGPPLVWRTLLLRPTPPRPARHRWALQWDPFRQCSWPPEDARIESFTSHVREQARALLGADLVRVEKFSTSVKDGVDLRESLRHVRAPSRSGPLSAPAAGEQRLPYDIYVKEIPPARGNVEIVVFLFDTPADPDIYTWHATWYAEHAQESTLCFYASPFRDKMVGPGIGEARYGGALFLFPPRPIPDIWTDPALSFARTMEERLIAAAALHSQERHIALVAPMPPRSRWRRIARTFQRQLIPIPLNRFSGQTIDRLRRFHVLNGHEIRCYAARFIHE